MRYDVKRGFVPTWMPRPYDWTLAISEQFIQELCELIHLTFIPGGLMQRCYGTEEFRICLARLPIYRRYMTGSFAMEWAMSCHNSTAVHSGDKLVLAALVRKSAGAALVRKSADESNWLEPKRLRTPIHIHIYIHIFLEEQQGGMEEENEQEEEKEQEEEQEQQGQRRNRSAGMQTYFSKIA